MGSNTTVQAAPAVNPAQVGAESLATQLRLAPDVYAAEAQYRPQYAALDQRILADSLLGTNGAPGLLDLYGTSTDRLGQQQIAANTQQREADIADVARLGGQALNAYRSANPALSRSMDGLEANISAARGMAPGSVGQISASAGNLGPAAMMQSYDARAGRLGRASQASAGNLGPAAMMQGYTAQAGNLGSATPYDAATMSATGVRDSALTPRLLEDATNYGRKSALQTEMERQAAADLAGAGNLSASELANAQQSARAAFAARGLNDSNAAINAEILQTDAARQAKQDRARQFAAGVDAAGQQQLQAGRNFAAGVEDSLLGRAQFNAASENTAAATNAAAINQARATNAGAANQFALTRYGTEADLASRNAATQTQASATNAGAANQFALSQFQTNADLAARNADASNQFALSRYGTEANLAAQNAAARTNASATNAGAANQFALSQFQTNADLARSNSAIELQRQMANLDYARAAQNDQFAREFQLAGMLQGQAQDPFQMVLGRSGATAQAQGATSAAGYTQNAGAKLFDPFNSGIMQIYAGNQANQQAANVASANNRSAQGAATMGAVGTVAGAALIAF